MAIFTKINIQKLYLLKFLLSFILIMNYGSALNSQVLISNTSGKPDSTAMMEVKSTTKGFLPPRMTASERNGINNPTPGLIIYCTDCKEMQMYNDTAWTNMIGLPPQAGWTCGDPLEYAGQSYATIQIGDQCWMAENLNVGTMINGTTTMSNNSTIEKYCYSDDPANCTTYGGLYQWDEMMQYTTIESTQGICPTGWHLPSDAEWIDLTDYVSSQSGNLCNDNSINIAKVLAATSNWNSSGNLCAIGNNQLTNNATGFSALPGGLRTTSEYFASQSTAASFWSSSESVFNAWGRDLYYNFPQVFRYDLNKSTGFSVRCVQD